MQLVAPTGVPHRVLLNKVDTRSPREVDDARALLAQSGVPVFRSVVRLLKAQPDGIRDGRLVTDARDESQRKARDDWQAITLELLGEWSRGSDTPSATLDASATEPMAVTA
jgi:chromosome partitioning protein